MKDDEAHVMVGHLNPHCWRCGRTAMQIASTPRVACRRMTLPFEDLPRRPVKAGVVVQRKDRAS